MKRNLVFVQVFLLALTIAFVGLAKIAGDANNDSIVDINDVHSVIEYLVDGKLCPSMENADANNSGTVDINDASYIIDYLLNPTSVLPDSEYDLNQAGKVVNYRMTNVEALDDSYLLMIQLRDNSYKTVKSPAAIDIEIVNVLGTTVYKKTHVVSYDDYTFETYSNALIYIPYNDITPGNPQEGVNFQRGRIHFNAYYPGVFSLETKIATLPRDLPYFTLADATTLTIPNLPIELNKYLIIGANEKKVSGVKVTKLAYEISEYWSKDKVSIDLKVSGTKTFDDIGPDHNAVGTISYKLYKDGAVIKSGSILTPSLQMGESFVDVAESIVVVEAGDYVLELIDTKK